jgi:hypothetical protein
VRADVVCSTETLTLLTNTKAFPIFFLQTDSDQTTAAAAVKNKRKRPVITFEMLKQNRGLPELFHNFPLLFKDLSRGPGHEVSDLRRLLELYKRWQQRLFPFCDFDAFIDSVEKIGHGHVVKSELHEMRTDILKKACKSYQEWLNADIGETVSPVERPGGDDAADPVHITENEIEKVDVNNDDDDELLRIAFEEEARENGRINLETDNWNNGKGIKNAVNEGDMDDDADEMALQVDMLEDEELLELAMQTQVD